VFGAFASDLRDGGKLAVAFVFAVPAQFRYRAVFGAPQFATYSRAGIVPGGILGSDSSIAYGMWGLFVLAPFSQHWIEPALRSGLSWMPGANACYLRKTAQPAINC